MHDRDAAVRDRAIAFTLKKWGSLRDLPAELASVVWVAALNAAEVGMRFEAAGSQGMVTGDLLSESHFLSMAKVSVAKVQLLDRILPSVRNAGSENERLGNAQLAVDVLKWNILNAGDMSLTRRAVARLLAKTPPEYRLPMPHELL